MAIFVEPQFAKQWECGICSNIMKEPRQFNCDAGDLFCKDCIIKLPESWTVSEGKCRQCPKCKKNCTIQNEYIKIPYIERQINALKVLCPNSKNTSYISNTNNDSGPNEQFTTISDDTKKRKIIVIDDDTNDNKRRKLNNEKLCDWSGIYSDLQKHIIMCPYQSIKCPFDCGNEMLRKNVKNHENICPNIRITCPNNGCVISLKRHLMNKHIKEHCPKTKVTCSLCNKTMIRTSLYGHDKYYCKEAQVDCEYCHKTMTRREKNIHWKICPDMEIKCDGCEKNFARKLMENHVENHCPETKVNCEYCKLKMKRSILSWHVYHQCTDIMVDCLFSDKGCNVKVKRKELAEHNEKCKYNFITCQHCLKKIALCDENDHLKICADMEIQCDGCKGLYARKCMDSHVENRCPETKVNCEYCGLQMKRGNLYWHVQNECEDVMVECKFVDYGCMMKIKRKDLENHLKKEMCTHLDIVKNVCDGLKNKYNKLENRCDEYEKKINILMSRISGGKDE